MTIKQKQWQLYYLGYTTKANIDGIVGAKTTAATKAFQEDNGLAVDGIFGQNTEAKSIEVIKTIQTALNAQIGAGLDVDGLAGDKTVAATVRYQQKEGLAADGQAGEKTRASLFGSSTTPAVTNETVCDFSKIKHFKRTEFACKCGKYCNGYPTEMKQIVVEVADRIREHFGKPVIVSSGVRCTKHNKNVGGVSNSRHLYGKAMDICVQGVSSLTLLAYIKQQPEIAYTYAIDSNYCHMDIK